MISISEFKEIALSFPEMEEAPHFENTAFKVSKEIVVTLNEKANRVCVKLTPEEQSLFCLFDTSIVYPVPNKWGTHGWTLIELATVPKETLIDALNVAYLNTASKKLATAFRTTLGID